jgi:hypothetical protein
VSYARDQFSSAIYTPGEEGGNEALPIALIADTFDVIFFTTGPYRALIPRFAESRKEMWIKF